MISSVSMTEESKQEMRESMNDITKYVRATGDELYEFEDGPAKTAMLTMTR